MKLLDTSVIIGLLRGEEKAEEIIENEDETLCTCSPIQCELYRGTKLARKTEEGEKEVEALINQLENLEATKESAKKVAELQEKYPEINTFDLMIAAISLSHQASLITKDKDFQKIEELETKIIK
ncbi:MAG: type II toxin-antitoxin system VapC family toxin [Candidatus Nanohaloarchaea archaeon]